MKIFGIGLSKTGTTSLAHALEILDYKVKDCMGVAHYVKHDISSIDANIIEHNDAFTDTPIPSFYKELDTRYPGSKFILTVRNTEGWLKSCKKQFNQKLAEKRTDAANQLFLDLYDSVAFDEEKFRNGYKNFTDSALEYFKNRPDDLLIINVSKGEGWEILCPFLNKPIPEVLFPKSNVTQIKWLNVHNVAQNIRHSACNIQKISQETPTSVKNRFYSLFGSSIDKRLVAATEKTENEIIQGLLKLNENISVVSKNLQNTSAENSNNWHHFWLLDCSLNSTPLPNTINLALIENGTPYIGIIYSLTEDIIYYSAIDKGVFKAEGNNPPQTISSTDYNKEQLIDTLCLVPITTKESKEWHTAAAHAIIKKLGFNLVARQNNKALSYNNTDWSSPVVKIVENNV